MSVDSEPSRKLLLVSYWYPPGVGAAAERMHSFARYLPEHGWEVHVLTAARTGNVPRDRGVTVHGVPDPLASSSPFADYDPRRKSSRLKAWLREWTFPDRFIAWRRAALKEAMGITRELRFDLVLASFPPVSVADLALRLRESGGPPMALDFRDRWLGPGGYEPASERAWRKHLDIERCCVAASTAIITVSEAMADAIAAEQGFARERIFVVPNGYDDRESIRASRPPAARGDPLAICHVGTVIPRNRPDLFFQSVAELHRSGGLAGTTFDFVGNLSRDYLQSLGLTDVIHTTGLVPREEARQRMIDAQALLLLTGDYVGRWGYNAKLFEYIRSGRPILCLEERPGSNDRRLLEDFAAERSFFATLGDAAALRTAVEQLYSNVMNALEPVRLPPTFDFYSRKNGVARLAGHLATVVQ